MGKVIDMDNMDLDETIKAAKLNVMGVILTKEDSCYDDLKEIIEGVRRRAAESGQTKYSEAFLLNVNGVDVEVCAEAGSGAPRARAVALKIDGKTVYDEPALIRESALRNEQSQRSGIVISDEINKLKQTLEDMDLKPQEQGIEI